MKNLAIGQRQAGFVAFFISSKSITTSNDNNSIINFYIHS